MKKMPKKGGWFKPRNYPHFDYPVSFQTAEKIALDPQCVAQRGFLPLIGYTDKRRTFRTDKSNAFVPRRQRTKVVGSKNRDIKYASHADAAILSYYAYLLQQSYDQWLVSNSLEKCVIGYRAGLGSNVDLAAEVFAEVTARCNVTCLCFDISDFFPCIPHGSLKAGLKEVLGVRELPRDWYNIFKNITQHAWVDLEEVSIPLGFKPANVQSPIVADVPAALRLLRGAKLIHTNQSSRGIPQGTPISAVFANVSMADFDLAMAQWSQGHQATYRRYSDDIILIVPPEMEVEASSVVPSLASSLGLTINSDKTDISRFSAGPRGLRADRALTYLGFTFDGERTMLRARTLSRYYRRMTYAVRGSIRGAGRKGQPASKAYRRALFRDLTHLGRANFYGYVAKAHVRLPFSIVKRQMRRHFKILLRKLSNRGK